MNCSSGRLCADLLKNFLWPCIAVWNRQQINTSFNLANQTLTVGPVRIRHITQPWDQVANSNTCHKSDTSRSTLQIKHLRLGFVRIRHVCPALGPSGKFKHVGFWTNTLYLVVRVMSPSRSCDVNIIVESNPILSSAHPRILVLCVWTSPSPPSLRCEWVQPLTLGNQVGTQWCKYTSPPTSDCDDTHRSNHLAAQPACCLLLSVAPFNLSPLYREINNLKFGELESPKCNRKPTEANPNDIVNGKQKHAEVGPVHAWDESMSE